MHVIIIHKLLINITKRGCIAIVEASTTNGRFLRCLVSDISLFVLKITLK